MLASVIRTVVPLLVGWLLSLGFVQAAGVTEDQLTAALTGLLTVLFQVGYYLVARLLEERFPAVGAVLLGRRGAPSYPPRGDTGEG